MRAAHLAVETARREREAAAIAEHKQMMMERRKEFEKRFKHVWSTGPAGISKFYVTAPNQAAGEKLIAELLAKTLTADVKQQNVNWRRDIQMADGTEDTWANHHHHREHQHRISGVTNDDRVAELIEEVATHGIGSAQVPFDCIITPIITGSPDYLEWI